MLLLAVLTTGCAALLPPPTGLWISAPPDGVAARSMQPDGKPNTWAVLIGGNTELRHRGNLAIAYQVLIERGVKREHIVVLDSGGPVPWYPWTDWASRAALELTFKRLTKAVEPHDELWVYVTGHGTQPGSRLKLNRGEVLTQREFVDLVNSVKPARGVIMYDHCYWGVLYAIDCRYRVVATAAPNYPTHATTFGRAWWRALRAGLTLDEAFTQARDRSPRDRPSQRPGVCSASDLPPIP